MRKLAHELGNAREPVAIENEFLQVFQFSKGGGKIFEQIIPQIENAKVAQQRERSWNGLEMSEI